MSRSSKRTVTATLLAAAGVAVLIALVLTANDKASASRPGGDKLTLTSKVGKVVKPIKAVVAPPPAVKKPPAPVRVVEVQPPQVRRPIIKKKKAEPPKVDVVFALDTTGSMGGLIRGAKRKIWSMANQIISGQPRPDVRIGLIGYRDRGDSYVTRRYALTEDIDDVYSRLQKFRAGGGGDTPEHVNRALSDAIAKMQWRKGSKVLRLIFLVGDAPPHEGRDGLYSAALAKKAAARGITINTVRCGSMGSTAYSWKRIANLSGGMYASIRQDGAMVAMATPMDRKLAKLNADLSSTIMPTGSAADKTRVIRRMKVNEAMAAPVQAESAKYRARSGKLDSMDLLSVLGRGRGLGSMSDDELPPAVAAMPAPARKGYVAKVRAKRKAIAKKIEKVNHERDAYIKAKKKPGRPTSFDDTLQQSLKAQGARIGVKY